MTRPSSLQPPASRLFLVGAMVLLLGCSKPTPSPPGGAPATGGQVAPAAPTIDGTTLRERLDQAVDFNSTSRRLNTRDHAAWQVVHGVLMYGRGFKIEHDDKLVGALDYLLGGGTLKGWNLRKGDRGVMGVLESGSKTGMGHPDQWLGYMSQCGLDPAEKLVVAGETYTIADLISQAQWDVHEGMEATWTLMAFATYLSLDDKWTAKDETAWSIERIVGMEAAQKLGDAACGGSHRMYALALAVNRQLKEKGELAGPWQKADEKIRETVKKAREFQEPDGSFSINYFERPGTARSDIIRRISTTGHTLEFLVVALGDRELREPWVTRAVVNLLDMLERTRDLPLECGALYHAVHGLHLYRMRRFGLREGAGSNSPDDKAAPTPPSTASRETP